MEAVCLNVLAWKVYLKKKKKDWLQPAKFRSLLLLRTHKHTQNPNVEMIWSVAILVNITPAI